MIKKIGDIPKPCTHVEHNPPSMIVLTPGIYQHTCPACGFTVEFRISPIIC